MDLDPTLLVALQKGDPRALESCYALFGDRVYRLCRLMLYQPTDAEDATQEVFVRVFERAGQFARRSRFTTWLHSLTVNHCLHLLEREGRRRTDPLPDSEAVVDPGRSPLDTVLDTEAQERLQVLLQRLPPEQRAVLVLRELEACSYAEIAEALGIPVGTVMSRLSRARERLIWLARQEPACSSESLRPTSTNGSPRTPR